MKSVLLTAGSLSLFSLVAIASSVNAEPIDMGKLPFDGGTSAKVSQTWHTDDFKLPALDIALAGGSRVRAPINSKVNYVCIVKNTDNHAAIRLESTSDSKLRYSLIHVKIDSKAVKVGSKFNQGDVIGTVAKDFPKDSCATSYGVHLHFGLPSKDVKIDGLTFSSTSPKKNAPLKSSNSNK